MQEKVTSRAAVEEQLGQEQSAHQQAESQLQ
jgi:hypothetical protein